MTDFSFLFATLTGLGKVLAHPLFYVAILLVFLQYRRQNLMERRMFGVRTSVLGEGMIHSLAYGLAGGIIATLLFTVLGVVLSPVDLIYVWIVALVFALFNARFICFAYAGGFLSLVSLMLNALPELNVAPAWVLSVYNDLRGLNVGGLMALVGILHLIEALLIRWNGAKGAMPVFVSGKRGSLIGGFILQKFWVVPMATFVYVGGDSGLQAPAWWPLLSFGTLGAGILIAPMPAVLGFSSVALSKTPEKKASSMSKYLMAYSVLLMLLAVAASYVPAILWVAALFCIVVHELLILWEVTAEPNAHPIYVRSNRGLKILAVLPQGPAQQMGLKSGETIMKVNGNPVSTPYDLHFAINQNPAYAKLELLTPEGEVRFASTPIYMGDHHQLGIVLVPDNQARQYVGLDSVSPWRWLWGRLVGGGKSTPSTYH